jgi:hypothetical protein
MKKIDELIIKYFSGMLNDNELKNFEEHLKSDPNLSEQFDLVKKQLGFFSNQPEIELDGSYFNNMVPQIRDRIENKRKVSLFRRISFAFPIAAILLVVLFINPFKRNEILNQPEFLASETLNNIDDIEVADKLISDYSFESFISFFTNGNNLETVFPDDVDISLKNISQYYDFSKIDLSEIEELSSQDLESLYSKLSMINL